MGFIFRLKQFLDLIDKQIIHSYWKNPGGKNKPEHYINHPNRSSFLVNLIDSGGDHQNFKGINKNSRILEIGCNVGRNLNALSENGFKNLSGIEISNDAIAYMCKTYPKLYSEITIYNDAVENVIKKIPDGSFDLIFTMAVLLHIHPSSEFVFKEMVRITNKYLITIEDEKSKNWRVFSRNYKKIFESLGMKEVHSHIFPRNSPEELDSYIVRVFSK